MASGATLRIGGGGSSSASAFTVAAGGTLQFAGHIFAAGGDVFTLGAGTVGGSGTVAVSGGELALGAGAVTVAGFAQGNATQSNCTVSGSGTLTVTGSAAFTGGAMRQTGPGVTLLEGSSTLAGNVVGGLFLEGGRVLENQGTFTLESGLIELGSGVGDATLRNDAGATIDLRGIALIGQGAGADALINAGVLEKTAGAGAAIVGVAVVNTGAIVARAFTLEFIQAISGDGTLAVEAGATLEADAGAAASLAMTFKAGGGTLALHHARAFAATIHGFAAGDAIDILGKRADRAVLESGDKLAIFRGSTRLATLQLAGDYTGATFNVASDGAGGTNITVTSRPRSTPPSSSPPWPASAAIPAGRSAPGLTRTPGPIGRHFARRDRPNSFRRSRFRRVRAEFPKDPIPVAYRVPATPQLLATGQVLATNGNFSGGFSMGLSKTLAFSILLAKPRGREIGRARFSNEGGPDPRPSPTDSAPTISLQKAKYNYGPGAGARQGAFRQPAHRIGPASGRPGLAIDQGALALDPPAIAGERTVGAHHPVAGDRHRQRVGRAGAGDRAHRPWLADFPGDVGVGHRLPRRDFAQSPPDALLEGRAAHVERQIEPDPGRLDEADHPRHQGFEIAVAADQPGARESILKITDQGLRIVADQDGADALVAPGHQDRAQRA